MSISPVTTRRVRTPWHGRLAHVRCAVPKRFLAATLALAALVSPHLARADAPNPPVQLASVSSHEFRFDATNLTPRPKRVFLAGTFNGWSPTAEPLTETAPGSGVFTLTKTLPDGIYFYKFVADGSRWLNDPNDDADLREDDGNGGLNSAILIGPDARKAPPPKPNHINTDYLLHNPADPKDLDNTGDGFLRLRLRTQANDVQQVAVVINDKSYTLSPTLTDRGLQTYEALVPVSGGSGYYLKLTDGSATTLLGGSGLSTTQPALIPIPPPRLTTPTWARDAVWYQIFPERFRNGDPSNDPEDKPGQRLIPWTADWWKTQPNETPGAQNFYRGAGNVWQRRFGGDIQGVKEKLPYLRSLGVNAIYFNPLFEASSAHKYDTRDFRHVDNNLSVKQKLPLEGETDDPATWKWSAGDKVFLDFIAEAHRQGFKVIIDGVFNHVGRDHPFFQDVLGKGPNSKYADWFEIERFADVHPTTEALFGKPGGMSFKAWDGLNGHLPAFKKDPTTGLAKGPHDHILAIASRWLAPDGDPSKGVDGFRIDAANEVPHPFWVDFRNHVKSTRKDAYITGEIWSDSSPWINDGKQFDAVMNYQFAIAAQKFFVNTTAPLQLKPSQFERELYRLVSLYPLASVRTLQNLFDSHDTDRLASMFVNPNRPYDGRNRIQDNGPDYSAAKPNAEQWTRMKQAVAFQMTFLGAPMIYYGDEAGMWSPDDPSDRQPMVWKDLEPYQGEGVAFSQDLFSHYQRTIAARNTLGVLRTGYFKVLLADDKNQTIAFSRYDPANPTNAALIILNRSKTEVKLAIPTTLPPNTKLLDYLSPTSTTLTTPENARPTLAPTSNAPTYSVSPDNTITLTLPPWSTTLLASPEVSAHP
jgi:glycosidase